MPSDREQGTSAAQRLVLTGRVDVSRARALHLEARALHDLGSDVSVEWSEVEALDAAALQILLALDRALRAAGRRLRVSPPSEAVSQTLALTGLAQYFAAEAAAP